MRADKFFADRFGSRTKAAQALRQGLVLRNGRPILPSEDVSAEEEFSFLDAVENYVSNGGFKLSRGLEVFEQSVAGQAFADLGASTGGFTDCLLQRGALRVFCVDVGECQLDSSLLHDERVTVMDGVNARHLTAEYFPVPLDGVTADLSFISLSLILPAVARILPPQGRAFLLFKPQFECGYGHVGKSGIFPASKHPLLLQKFYREALPFELAPQDIVNAPVRPKKNVEYVVFLKKNGTPISLEEFLARAARLR